MSFWRLLAANVFRKTDLGLIFIIPELNAECTGSRSLESQFGTVVGGCKERKLVQDHGSLQGSSCQDLRRDYVLTSLFLLYVEHISSYIVLYIYQPCERDSMDNVKLPFQFLSVSFLVALSYSSAVIPHLFYLALVKIHSYVHSC